VRQAVCGAGGRSGRSGSGRRRSMTTIQRAYQAERDLNHQQITACKQHAGAARWAYHGGLQRKQEAYRTSGKSLSALELHRELNALKPTEVPWMDEVSKCAPQEALRNKKPCAIWIARSTDSAPACAPRRQENSRASWATRSARAESRGW